MEYGSTVLYKKWVTEPAINRNIIDQEKLFKIAGFDGCIGSTDATHVAMLKCPAWASNNNKGFKLNLPSRTYNATVDHSRRILCSTTGHPATWNDKTLVLFDPLLTKVKDRKLHENYEFRLYEHDRSGNIVEVCYVGVWFIVDNGYLAWSCTVPPVKDGITYKAIRFSEWLESMRKDIECTFGIVKGRFAILRYGTRLHSIAKCDQLWLTCLALHNLLIEVDGLAKNWEQGFPSDWEVISKNFDTRIDTPFAITKLNRSLAGDDTTETPDVVNSETTDSYEKYTINGKRIVAKMPLNVFRNCLINHFDIRFKMNTIEWPTHINKPRDV